jgi:hypothetical protein
MTPPTVRIALIILTALAAAMPLHTQTEGPSAGQLKSLIATRQQRMELLREEFK